MNRMALLCGAVLAGTGLILLDALVLERYFFQVNTFPIGKENSSERLRILLLTDLHLRQSIRPFYSRLASRINHINPDLLLISGDTIDASGKGEATGRFFSRLNPLMVKVAIPGNHDHKAAAGMRRLKRVCREYGCHLLINESKPFTLRGKRVMITGLDDFIEGNPSFSQAIRDVGYEENHILLVHSPLQHEAVIREVNRINAIRSRDARLNIGYIFAGHNHGGQVRLAGYAPVLPEKSGGYVNGWYHSKDTDLYVSKGFGTSAIPVRFGARSEITLFSYGV